MGADHSKYNFVVAYVFQLCIDTPPLPVRHTPTAYVPGITSLSLTHREGGRERRYGSRTGGRDGYDDSSVEATVAAFMVSE